MPDRNVFGTSGYGEGVAFDFERSPLHLALQGRIRSGKSVGYYGILSAPNVAANPNIEVCGIDPTGVLLNPWIGQSDRIALCAPAEKVAEVIDRLVSEMDTRIRYLLSEKIDKIERFSPDRPVLLVVLDEWPGSLAKADLEDRAAGKAIRLGVQRLVLEGAKVGVRVALAGQKLLADSVGSEVRANLPIRISFAIDAPEAIRLLHPVIDDPEGLTQRMRTWEPGRAVLDFPGRDIQEMRFRNVTYREYVERVEGGLSARVSGRKGLAS